MDPGVLTAGFPSCGRQIDSNSETNRPFSSREEGKSSPLHERYRLTIAFYPLETGGADATRTPPAKKRTAKKRGAR